jgi:hypothetical protein
MIKDHLRLHRRSRALRRTALLYVLLQLYSYILHVICVIIAIQLYSSLLLGVKNFYAQFLSGC